MHWFRTDAICGSVEGLVTPHYFAGLIDALHFDRVMTTCLHFEKRIPVNGDTCLFGTGSSFATTD